MSISRATASKFIQGDEQATEKVYLAYKNLMYFIIASYVSNKSDCDDVLSEAFLKAMQNRAQLEDPSKLKSYLCTIAKHQALDFLKKNREIPEGDTIDEIYGEDDRSNSFLSMIEPLLSNKETIVVYYKIGFGYTWEEIAEDTGISESTARRLYASAKEKLKKGLA